MKHKGLSRDENQSGNKSQQMAVERFTLATKFKKERGDDDISVTLFQFKFQELLKVPDFASRIYLFAFVQNNSSSSIITFTKHLQ